MNSKCFGELAGMKLGLKLALGVGVLSLGAITPICAQEVAQQDLVVVQQELEKAKSAVIEAREAAEQIILDAQKEAALIRQSSPNQQQLPVNLEPVALQNGKVAVEIAAGTVQEIAMAIMPTDWRVMVDVKDPTLLERRFQFVSTKSRDQALRDLLKPVGLQHQYFFDMKDASGVRSPLLVISKR